MSVMQVRASTLGRREKKISGEATATLVCSVQMLRLGKSTGIGAKKTTDLCSLNLVLWTSFTTEAFETSRAETEADRSQIYRSQIEIKGSGA